jgi:hypothetical protein
LTPASGEPGRWTCAPCGRSFGAKPKNAGPAAPTNAFDFSNAAPKEPAATAPKPHPASGFDPRMMLIFGAGGVLAVLLLLLMGGVVLAVALWPRPAAPTPVAAVPPVSPAATPPDHPFTPAPLPAPPADEPNPTPPKKPDPPKDEPSPTPPAPPVPADPGPKPPPLADPQPVPPDPQPMPAPQPAAGPIDQAIDKAVAYLKKQALNANGAAPGGFRGGFTLGRQVGEMGLIGLALLESGAPPDDKAVMACTDAVRTGEPMCSQTYEMAISIWFLDRLGDPKDEDLIRDLGARLIAGQMGHGLWTYNCPTGAGPGPKAPGAAPPGLPGLPVEVPFGIGGHDLSQDQIKELMETLDKYDPSKEIPEKKRLAPVCSFVKGKAVDKGQDAPGPPGQPKMFMGGGDLSLTQFAVLGLWVARKHKVPVDRSLLLTEARVRASQESDGGWAYSAIGGLGRGMGETDSMTCSGMMELAVGRAVSQAPGAKTEAADPQFEKGLEYLAELFDRGIMPGANAPAVNAAQQQNLSAAIGKLWGLQAAVTNPFMENQPAVWKKSLKAFQDELEKTLALDIPADAKKDLQDVEDAIKKYEASPTQKDKAALQQVIQKTGVLQGNGLVAFGFNTGPGRFIKPGKSNRNNADDIYCLWSLERLCMVCDLQKVAGHDWYSWGASLLLAHQNDDGSWPSAGICGQQVDTCLAVLFLKRVNVAKDLTAQLKTVAPIKDLPPEKLKYISSPEPSPGLTPSKSPGETPKP